MIIKNDKLLEHDLIPMVPLSQAGLDSGRNRSEAGGFAAVLDKEMKANGNSREKTSPGPEQTRESIEKPLAEQENKPTDEVQTGEQGDNVKQKKQQESGTSVYEAKARGGKVPQTGDQPVKSAKNAASWPELSELLQENRKLTATARDASVAMQAERINLQNNQGLENALALNPEKSTKGEVAERNPEFQDLRRSDSEKTDSERQAGKKVEGNRAVDLVAGREDQPLKQDVHDFKPQITGLETSRGEAERIQIRGNLQEVIPPNTTERAMLPELVMRRVEDAVLMVLNRNDNSLIVKLHPPELGRVQIDMQIRNGGTEVRILAETPQVREVIQANLEQLRNSMENSGYLLSRLDVEVGGFSRFTHNQGQRRNGNRVSLSGREGLNESPGEQNENPAAAVDLIRGGRVNLVV